MAFEDGLINTADVYTVNKTVNSIGQEQDSRVILYTKMPCRIGYATGNMRPTKGVYENFQTRDRLTTTAKYNGADRGDQVEVEGKVYIITKKMYLQARSKSINMVVYELEELK